MCLKTDRSGEWVVDSKHPLEHAKAKSLETVQINNALLQANTSFNAISPGPVGWGVCVWGKHSGCQSKKPNTSARARNSREPDKQSSTRTHVKGTLIA